MTDVVYTAFLETVAEDVAACNAASDILRLTVDPGSGVPPHSYAGVLAEVEHLRGSGDGTVRVSAEPVEFQIQFPADYCRSTDTALQFRVASVRVPLFHPNVKGSIVCLGKHFAPGTRVRPLVEQIYRIVAGRVRATDSAFDLDACRYYLSHAEQLHAMRARPLWRRPVVARAELQWSDPPALDADGSLHR
jgi:hypothetical protein